MSSRSRLVNEIKAKLQKYEEHESVLPGISMDEIRAALILQIVDSICRVEYVKTVKCRPQSCRRADPSDSTFFDPLRAAIYHQSLGHIDEAFWLVFIYVHFGKSLLGGWRYAREIYGKLEQNGLWNWQAVSESPDLFQIWLEENYEYLKRPGAGFGNHRKYESLRGSTTNGTGAVVTSYVEWVGSNHMEMIARAEEQTTGRPEAMFDWLYSSMHSVRRFGRLAKFDYLTMLGKLQLAPISPGSAYIEGSTGPLRGARLLFGDNSMNAKVIDRRLTNLDLYLRVGMQVLEDSICNWQKSPDQYRAFRG